jgi:capsular exopolysaccharide synthesis family protein
MAAKIANSTANQLIKAVNDVEDVSLVKLSVFEQATEPVAPASPKVPINLAVGLVMGLLIGLGLAAIREVVDTRLRSQEEIERFVKVGTLGTFAQEPSLVGTASLVTQGDRYSARAESFRQLRTHLHFTNISGGTQSVVVSSSIPGEGKTSTAVNLAIMLAESGVKVLLVDADLRRPRVAKLLGLEGSIGLTGVLTHTVELEDAIQPWGPDGSLDVLTSGRFAPNPSELLGSPNMEKILARMESLYEVVIIDAPPLLPVTDPAVLSSAASGLLLVVSADGRTHRAELIQAVKNVEAVNARLLGVVINRLPTVRGTHGYYDYKPEIPIKRRAVQRPEGASMRRS